MRPSGVQAICFDCFGTLLEVTESDAAYRRLVVSARDRRSMRRQVLTKPWPFEVHATRAGWSAAEVSAGQDALRRELASIVVLDEAPFVLQTLREHGLRLALCSNLATEFGPAARSKLGFTFDATVLSYEVGCLKPEAAIFAEVCRRLGCRPEKVLMVGDSMASDIDGARAGGMSAVRVQRDCARALPGDITNLSQLLR